MHVAACPTPAQLAEFALGRLPPGPLAVVAGHVEQCPTCDAALQQLDHLSDPLLQQLRHRALAEGSTTDALPLRLLDAARAARERVGTPPRRLGKFELLDELGSGSFGQVYRARDTELGRFVAIKVQRAGGLACPEERERFLREARSAAQLEHPSIVTLYEAGQAEDGTCYLVEELIEGTTLADRLEAGPVEPRLAVELVAAVADALAYAHRHGIIHRDIKPSNILLDGDGRPHLGDFGLARREADDAAMTLDGQVLGTPAYMSPEQASGESHQADGRTDVYSLGVILYELLTGERPFRGTPRMLLHQVLHDEPRPPRQLNDRCPRDLETITLKAMAKSPGRRYAGAVELADDLRRWQHGEPIRARPVGWPERLWRWCVRNPLAASLLVAVSLGSGVGLGALSRLSGQLVQSTALESAAQQAEMMEEAHNHFSDVVEKVKRQGYEITHDPRPHGPVKGRIDIEVPARFAINLGQRIGEKGKVQVRMFSNYPFLTRQDGFPQDEFEYEALERLEQDPNTPVARFTQMDGRPVLRYVIARRMQASCIDCHNRHPDSTKHDWRVGDVRGVLEVIRPLDQDVARTRQGLRGTFLLVGSVSAALLGLSVLVLVGTRRRSR